jgi:hypothetical protein
VNKHDISNCFKQKTNKQTKRAIHISTNLHNLLLSSEIIQNKIHKNNNIRTLSNSGGYDTKHSLLHYHRLYLYIIAEFGIVASYSDIQ